MEGRRQSCCERFNQYIYSSFNYIRYKIITPINHNKSWSLQAIAYLGTVGYFGISTGIDVQDTGNLSYAVARASGAMLRVAVPSVILPTLVACASRLQRSGIEKYFGLKNRILSHKLIAIEIIGLSITHAVAHYFYQKENYLKQTGISGLIMLGSLALPLGGVYLIHSLKFKFPFSFGFLVKRPHQIGAVIFITAFGVHTPDFRLLPSAAAMGGVWLLDRFYAYFSCQHKVMLKKIRRIDNTHYFLLRLTIPPHLNLNEYLPGQYVELSISNSAINRTLEAPHPFTIVTIDKRTQEIYLAIKQNGWWTSQLNNIIKQKNIPAILWGPYGSPLNSFYKHSQMAVITAGIGMTPFLAYVFWLVERQQTSPILSLDIALTKIEEIFLWIKAFNHPNIQRINFIESINIYISQQTIGEIRNGLAKMKHEKHLHFVFPEEALPLAEKKEEENKHAEEKGGKHSILVDIIDDDFFVNTDDPDLLIPLPQSLEKDQLIHPEPTEKKLEPPSPFLVQTPGYAYPALNTTGASSVKDQRKYLDINIYTRRMNIEQIFSNTLFKKAAVCAGDQLTKEVARAAMNHGVKLYKESF